MEIDAGDLGRSFARQAVDSIVTDDVLSAICLRQAVNQVRTGGAVAKNDGRAAMQLNQSHNFGWPGRQ
jgi:hypothetical protein